MLSKCIIYVVISKRYFGQYCLMAKSAELERLGQRIAELRKFRRLSQGELGDKIGKDRQAIQRMESGNTNPTFESLLAIARGLGVSLSQLMDFEITDHSKNP